MADGFFAVFLFCVIFSFFCWLITPIPTAEVDRKLEKGYQEVISDDETQVVKSFKKLKGGCNTEVNTQLSKPVEEMKGIIGKVKKANKDTAIKIARQLQLSITKNKNKKTLSELREDILKSLESNPESASKIISEVLISVK